MRQVAILAVTTGSLLASIPMSLTLQPIAVGQEAACPYLAERRDKDTATTTATYDAKSKTLNIQVARSIPAMMWPMAESMTRKNADKILQNCPNISLVRVKFQSGQSLVHKRPT
jgi:hypothetical protein